MKLINSKNDINSVEKYLDQIKKIGLISDWGYPTTNINGTIYIVPHHVPLWVTLELDPKKLKGWFD